LNNICIQIAPAGMNSGTWAVVGFRLW